MKLIAEAGTDVASVVLFDPEALSEDFDLRYKKEYLHLLAQLHVEGKIFYTETGSDGAYLLHLYLDEPIPSDLSSYCHDPIVFKAFPVPSGSLWFTGAEYAFQRDDTRLRKHSHMGSHLEIPIGDYWVRISRTEYPDEYIEEQVRLAMGTQAYTKLDSMGCSIGIAVLSSIAAGLALFLSCFAAWSLILTGACIFFWIRILLFKRSPTYKSLAQHRHSIDRNFPSIVAEFQSNPST